MARVIIAAAGPQNKWNGYLGVPSHLVPVDGEPLLTRTVRQAIEIADEDEVFVTYPPGDDRYLNAIMLADPGLVRVNVEEREESYPSEYDATRDLWSETGRTILLLGDVYFTNSAIDTIARFKTPKYQGFGRRGKSRITGCRYGELFAASWTPADHAKQDEYLTTIRELRASGRITRPTGWMLLRAWQGTDLGRHQCLPAWMTTIDDETEDWDFPADYHRHPAIQRKATEMYEAGKGHSVRSNDLPRLFRNLGVKPRHVVHVGAHDGEEMPSYEAAGFEKITLVEPSPEHAAKLRAKYPYADVIEAAAGLVHFDEVPLYVMPVSNMSTIIATGKDTPKDTIMVEQVRLADIAQDANVAVIDVQGAELDVLRGADLERYDVVMVETCTVEDPTMASLYSEVTEYMLDHGYEVVEYWTRDYQWVAKWGRKRDHRQAGEVRDVVYRRLPKAAQDHAETTTPEAVVDGGHSDEELSLPLAVEGDNTEREAPGIVD